MMTNEPTDMSELTARVRSITSAESAAEIFKRLAESCLSVAPRAAVYLLRKTAIQGWGSVGYGEKETNAQRAYCAPLDRGWLGRLATRATEQSQPRDADDGDPEFGQGKADEAVGTAVRIDGKPVALIVAERKAEELPWSPSGLELIVAVAQLRLKLLLALRVSQGSSAGARPAAKAAPRPAESVELAAAPPKRKRPAGMDAARRYARLVATDIRLYNEEAVMLGRRNGDLVNRLSSHLGRGKETFLRRHADLGPAALELLHEAYVQVLAAGDPSLIPVSTLDQGAVSPSDTGQ